MAKIWYVDIPDRNTLDSEEPAYYNVDIFHSKKEAITYCKEKFGADKNGRISLITEGDDGHGQV